MYALNYQKASSVDAAIQAVTSSEDARFLAGGMTLIPTLKQRLTQVSDLVDLSGIGDLAGIRIEGNIVIIRAMTRHADVAASSEIAAKIPALVHLAGHIGDPQVRNRGPIGGSLADNHPAPDYPAPVLGPPATTA